MSWRRKPGKRTNTRGFILLEVLVAASVATVLLAAVMRIFASTWSGIGAMREDADAMLVARTVIEASTPRSGLVAGTQQGTTGRYAWEVAVIGPVVQTNPVVAASLTPQSSPDAGASGNGNPNGNGNTNGNQNDPDNPAANAANAIPWNLFRVVVAVRAPNGRRTFLETYRLSR